MEGLDAVAVVDVEIHVQDPQTVAPRPGNGEGHIVVDAETARPSPHGVVEPAARLVGVLHVSAQDRLDGPDRTTGDCGRRLVHAGEGRVVARTDARLGGRPGSAENRRTAAM